MITTEVFDDWVCRQASNGSRSAAHPDGTQFWCDKGIGLTATRHQGRALPPMVLAWLVQPALGGLVKDGDLGQVL